MPVVHACHRGAARATAGPPTFVGTAALDYAAYKLLHVMAAAAWVSGLLGAALGVAFHDALDSVTGRSILVSLRSWHRLFTMPAMLAALGCGGYLTLQTGWIAMPWLQVKLALVASLVVMQIALDHALGRIVRAPAPIGLQAPLRHAALLTFLAALTIVGLALAKPF